MSELLEWFIPIKITVNASARYKGWFETKIALAMIVNYAQLFIMVAILSFLIHWGWSWYE